MRIDVKNEIGSRSQPNEITSEISTLKIYGIKGDGKQRFVPII